MTATSRVCPPSSSDIVDCSGSRGNHNHPFTWRSNASGPTSIKATASTGSSIDGTWDDGGDTRGFVHKVEIHCRLCQWRGATGADYCEQRQDLFLVGGWKSIAFVFVHAARWLSPVLFKSRIFHFGLLGEWRGKLLDFGYHVLAWPLILRLWCGVQVGAGAVAHSTTVMWSLDGAGAALWLIDSFHSAMFSSISSPVLIWR